MAVPVTALVRLDDPRRDERGKIQGTLKVYDPDKVSIVRIDSYAVPLESDSSPALGYRFESAPIRDLRSRVFAERIFRCSGVARITDCSCSIPNMRGLIPVVLVHGPASSFAR